jgi:hypothetical protein
MCSSSSKRRYPPLARTKFVKFKAIGIKSRRVDVAQGRDAVIGRGVIQDNGLAACRSVQ